MNSSLHNILNRISVREPHAPVARRQAGAAMTFQKVLQSSAAPAGGSSAAAEGTVAAPATTAEAPGGRLAPTINASMTSVSVQATSTGDVSLPRLGPFTGDPNAKPAPPIPDPAPMPTAPFTPLPASQQALLNQPWDPFNKAQHEATMNNWYMHTIQNSNQQKLQIYQHGVEDWKVNAAHCRDLGIQAPPPPTPPVLEAVGPLPDGYWFGTHA